MQRITFQAYVIANEIDLNKIASSCGIPKKYTWEEPLILHTEALKKIAGTHIQSHASTVYIFSFGSIVFVNADKALEEKVFAFFKIKPDSKEHLRYQDDYELRVGPLNADEDEARLTDKYVLIEELEPYHTHLIATIIAKSVALEKIEEQLSNIMDSLEPMIERMSQGKLRVNDKKLARVSAKIARFEYTSIAYIMILDKPDATWSNTRSLDFYDDMSEFFELNDRYQVIKEKTELLNNVVENVSSTSHTVKSVTIEIIVLILIAVEVVIMIVDLFK